jgi:hypothetical protein
MNRQIATIALVLAAISLAGILLGFLYSRLPANSPQESRAGCESVGGDWDAAASRCLVSYKEAGESCTNGGQCKSGICTPPELSDQQRAALILGPISGIVGVCSGNMEPTGCVPQVLKSIISTESMCNREQ